MNCIEQFREFDIKEINSKTKIALESLNDIFECRFDKINRTRARGFASILQREYKIDMSEWLNAYDEYHTKEKEAEIIEDAESAHDEPVTLPIIESASKPKGGNKLVVAFAVLFAIFAMYFLYNNFTRQDSRTSQRINAPSASVAPSAIPAESSTESTASTDISAESTLGDSINATDSVESTQSAESSDENAGDIKDSTDSANAKNATDSTNLAESVESGETPSPNHALPIPQNTANNTTILRLEELSITPKAPLWVGVIDLPTMRKKQVSISAIYTITLDTSKLIRTGHGHFDLNAPNMTKNYMGGDNKYFHYTRENGLREITHAEFLNLNKGQEW